MTQVLTWQYLSPEHVHKCLSANGPEALYKALIEADAENKEDRKLLRTMFVEIPIKTSGGQLVRDGEGGENTATRHSTHGALYIQPFEAQQKQVALDLFFHLILKCREFNLSPEKTSATVGIVAKTHSESMRRVLSMADSFAYFGQLLQLHAVHRPPFSSAILTIEDAKVLTDFFLGTYYRHYKLYLYVFTPRRVATVKGFTLGNGVHDVPPLIAPQTVAVPLAKYEAAKNEAASAEQAKVAAEVRERQHREESEKQRILEEQNRIPPVPSGLQQQLSAIRSNVVGLSVNKLDALEAKLDRIEARIAESQQSTVNSQPATLSPQSRKGAALNGSPKRR